MTALLSGCGYEDPSRFAPICPQVVVLGDAADLTRFTATATTGHDVSDMVIDAHITGLSGNCARMSDTVLGTHVKLSLRFMRGPAATERAFDVPYFIGVFEGDDRILDKKIIPIHVVFPPNTDRVSLDTQDVELDLPISGVKTGAVYTGRVGFQLTPDQLAFNRKRGPR